ncbi:MAG TPA: ABC transporter permease [Thermoanaerobaculia bacterium]|nr:ABC transporter permease [Thermoanaerobaculia bacterium]HQR66332.1 ABC transporter permease [Thermoanaerobaculia bacterium]
MRGAFLVLRHLGARPLRTALTMGAIGLSAGLMGFLLVVADALKEDWSPLQGRRVVVMAKTSFFERLPAAYLSRIEEVPGAEHVAPFDFLMVHWGDPRPENLVGLSATDAGRFVEVLPEARPPEEQLGAWKADLRGCVIGPVLVEKFGWKVGQRLVFKAPVPGGAVETTIRGILSDRLYHDLFIHRKYLENLTGEPGKVAFFWVLASSRPAVAPLTAEIERRFDNAPIPIRAMTEKQWQLEAMQRLGNVKLLIGSLGLATAFALVLITSNTLAMGARERRGETAVLRVLGYTRSAVARLLFGEAALYGLGGALLGLGLMRLFIFIVAEISGKTQFAVLGPLMTVDAGDLLAVVGLAVAVAVVAGLVPGLNLSRRPIVELLREA